MSSKMKDKKKKLTDLQIKKICIMRLEGNTPADIARAIGVAHQHIAFILQGLRNQGLKFPKINVLRYRKIIDEIKKDRPDLFLNSDGEEEPLEHN